jgi:hypothetical protein
MIDQTIHEIEARIQAAEHLSFGQRKELQALVADLKVEVHRLSETHGEDAEIVAAFARATAGEGLKASRNPQLLKLAVDGIRASVKRFETSHPGLTLTVNGLSTFFANIGI